ncbi:hypothetical protein IMSHALPRED_002358 [Imshaugia aleurites]|uniref:GH16 domain-containing protein n=1 Tax=Imshaugia aleurites TaxID=172621 RepID=A0A8H3EX51_9LECA|nr:hypothetical protein IMSHALPRED_002358 [Imshaugia aleurites]
MLFSKKSFAAAAALAALPSSLAQVTTVCNPLNVTCPNGLGLSTSSYFIDFTKQSSLPSDWTSALDEYTTFNSTMGAAFNFGKQGDSPTIYSNFFFFFGRIEYVAQVAPGKGIVSSMVLLSDDLDEIDWEFTGTNTAQAQTNYFGKGVLNYGVSEYVGVASPQTGFHTYAVDWSPTEIVWSIDGNVMRTLTADEAGNEFPQTPMKVSLGLWDGGDASKQSVDTVQWAGGPTQLPPTQNYTSYIKSVKITNANPAMQYEYTDKSGSWQSIKAINNTASPSSINSTSSSMASSSMISSSMKLNTTVIPGTTVISTSEVIITACPSSVLDCPARSAPVTSKVMVTSTKNATTMVVAPSPSAMAVSASAPSGANMSSSVTAKPTVASVVSEIVYTTVTSCPVTSTKVANGTTSVVKATSLSTILSTSTSTICTKCVAPPMTSSTASPMSTVAAVTTEIVYTTLTSCPVTSTKIANGTTGVVMTYSVSTTLSTSTSTICTKCVAPQTTSSSSSSLVQNAATAMPPSVAANAYNAYTAAHACTGSAPVPGFTPPVSSVVHSTVVSTIVSASSTQTSSTVMTSVVWTYPVKTTTSTTYLTLSSTGFVTVTDSDSSVHVATTVVPTIVASTAIAPVAAPAQTSTSYSTAYSTVTSTMTDSASSTYIATSIIPSVVTSIIAPPAAAPTTTIASTILSTVYSTSISTIIDSASSTSLATSLIPSVISTVTMVAPVTSTAYSTIQETLISTVVDTSASSTSLSTTVLPSVLFSAMPAASPSSSSSSSSLLAFNPVNGFPAVAPQNTTTTTLGATSTMTAASTSTGYLNGTVAGTGAAASSGFPIASANSQPFIGAAANLAPAGLGGLAVAAFVVLFL